MPAFGTADAEVLEATSKLCSDVKGRDGKRRAFGQFGTSLERMSGTTGGASK